MVNYYKEKIKIAWNYLKSEWLVVRKRQIHKLSHHQKYAFIFFAADYNNLGDLAITLSQQKFLLDLIGNDYTIIKIDQSDTYSWIDEIKKLPPENILITLIGGGNSGSLYDFIETPRRFLLKCFRNYKIVSFPQTIYFDSSERASVEKKEFTKLANKCNNLTLVAREKCSEQVYLDNTNAHILLTPDIVFSYEKYVVSRNARDLNSVVLILRNDKEKSLDISFQNSMISLLKERFYKVEYMDTCDVEYQNDNAQELLDNYLLRLQTAGLVITDRLHGMILSYITRTPCIVFANNNWKIKSTYDTWLKRQSIVHFFDFENGKISDLKQLIEDIINQKEYISDNLNGKFDVLREAVRGKI